LTLEELQLRHLVRVLDRVQGNKARAAEILGVGRNTIYHMLSRRRTGADSQSYRVKEPLN
jgi:DNA-binding protein Fis